MASHIRYYLMEDGGHYAGHNVFRYFRNKGLNPKGMKEVIEAAKTCEAKLWIFREPRGVAKRRSRYKKICNTYGLNPPRKKTDWVIGDVPLPHGILAQAGRRQNDRANQPNRFARRREQVLRIV